MGCQNSAEVDTRYDPNDFASMIQHMKHPLFKVPMQGTNGGVEAKPYGNLGVGAKFECPRDEELLPVVVDSAHWSFVGAKNDPGSAPPTSSSSRVYNWLGLQQLPDDVFNHFHQEKETKGAKGDGKGKGGKGGHHGHHTTPEEDAEARAKFWDYGGRKRVIHCVEPTLDDHPPWAGTLKLAEAYENILTEMAANGMYAQQANPPPAKGTKEPKPPPSKADPKAKAGAPAAPDPKATASASAPTGPPAKAGGAKAAAPKPPKAMPKAKQPYPLSPWKPVMYVPPIGEGHNNLSTYTTHYLPEISCAAMSIAMMRLPVDVAEKLFPERKHAYSKSSPGAPPPKAGGASLAIDLCASNADSHAVTRYKNTVKKWQMESQKGMVLSQQMTSGKLPEDRAEGYDWLRKSEKPQHRFLRVCAMMMTMRSVEAGGYTMTILAPKAPPPAKAAGAAAKEPAASKAADPKAGAKETAPKPAPKAKAVPQKISVDFKHVQEMLKSTELIMDGDGLTGNNKQMAQPPTAAKHKLEIEAQPDLLSLQAAELLIQEKYKVAVVSAASGYHVGGGFMTGGRHALEEATCVQTTLFPSLRKAAGMAKAQNVQMPSYVKQEYLDEAQKIPKYHLHVPETGAISSPKVEIFRGGTTHGYPFYNEVIPLAGVVSIAMPNYNTHIRDCPVDGPPENQYKSVIEAKMRAMMYAASKCGADALVMPDCGCGVFQNDPVKVGVIFGQLLKDWAPTVFRRVVVTGKPEFCNEVLKKFTPDQHAQNPLQLDPTIHHGGFASRVDGMPAHAKAAPVKPVGYVN